MLYRDGDVYAAMRDCYEALTLDRNHLKSHFRLAKCLNDLKWHSDARDCIQIFCSHFPDYAKTPACENLVKEINIALNKAYTAQQQQQKKFNNKRFKQTHSISTQTGDVQEDKDEENENRWLYRIKYHHSLI